MIFIECLERSPGGAQRVAVRFTAMQCRQGVDGFLHKAAVIDKNDFMLGRAVDIEDALKHAQQ